MTHSGHAGRGFALGFIVVLVVSAMLPLSALAAKPASPRLGLNDEQLLSKAVASGQQTVTILIAARGGEARQAASAVAAVGGTVQYREDSIGYVRAVVPVARVRELAANQSIAAVDLDEILEVPDPRPQGVVGVIPQAAPSAATPRNNPYMPIRDVGSAQFMAAHPTWDGRGVTIGIIDTGVSLDHPSLLTTSTGEPKVIDWVTGTAPTFTSAGVNTDNDPTWIQMSAQVSGATFTFNGATYTAPVAGSYRIGLFNERDARLGGEVGTDVNRDGNPAGSSGLFAVLWNTNTNQVWVDTNQNRNFADDAAMTDYKVNRDVGFFGTDNPATAVAERMPFVVQTNGQLKVVNIGIVSGAHGSHVAGIASGNSLFGGEMSGNAPGAQIVSVRACLFVAGCTSHALLEGMIYAAKQSNVDVINMSIGGLPGLNDGNNARAVLYDRLIEQYNVQMFFSAGNSGPGMNTIGDPAVATKVVGVGAYITDDTYLADYGAQLYEDDNLHYFSSRGPREDGGFKPEIVAPGAAISTIPRWQPQGCLAQTCPIGYALMNGTSMAAPQATGAAALLISAAEQAGAQHQPAQLRQAIRSSTRYLTGRYQAYEQGNGLLNVGAAWELLRTNISTVGISSAVEVNTVLSDFLATPGVGVGINDREGVAAGDSYTRAYTFTRTSGPGGTVTYNLSWVDNDGTFTAPASVALPKNTPVTVNVGVNPSTSGSHSAILNLDDPATAGVEYQTMNTVIAAEEFEAADNFAVSHSGSLGPGQFETFFFHVPEGTPAFKVDLAGGGAAGNGAIRFLRWHPWGLGIDSNAVSNCYNGAPGGCSTGSPTSRSVADPDPGVWEVTVDARRNSDAVSAPFTLTASILGVAVTPDPDIVASATIGTPVARSYDVENLLGQFSGGAVDTTLGSARIQTPSIAHHAQQIYTVNVPAGTASLRATIGNPSDPAADLDLYIYNCTDASDNPATLAGCVLVAQQADGDSNESATVNGPGAGNWSILIDGFNVPAGTTTYDYIDVYFKTTPMGTIDVTDTNSVRAPGATWTVPANVTANAAPGTGRVLYGNVEVRLNADSAGALVGRNEVIIQNVGP